MIESILNYKILPEKFNQGPFESFDKLEEEYLDTQKKNKGFLGNFILLSSGELKKGIQKGLHTLVAELDVGFPNNIHIHFGKFRKILNLRKEEKRIVTEHYPISEKRRAPPMYTLEGLYDALPNQEIGTRLKALKHEFHKHEFKNKLPNFNNSIAKRTETKLKILENIYTKDLLK